MKSIFFPSVRGIIGDWVYYSSVMPIQEVSARVDFVKDVHKTDELSELLQRGIKRKRINEISEYLSSNKERFLNSLVLAVYGSNPEWFPASISAIQSLNFDKIEGDVGLLEFSGKEKIIPIDGQHRLAGIKNLINMYNQGKKMPDIDFPFINDIIPVIFIAHKKNTEENRLRTRRLFTTLNKYAVKVNRYEVISLDEDDPMAITTRWLVEKKRKFNKDRIKLKGGANISSNDSHLTTIENLYDVLVILFTKVYQKTTKKHLTTCLRPSEKELDGYKEYALKFFSLLELNYPVIKKFYLTDDYKNYAIKQRKSGNLLFRPVGLKLLANLLSKQEDIELAERFNKIKQIPINLNIKPYIGLLYSYEGRMLDQNEAKVRNILLSALGVRLNRNEKRSAMAGLSILKGTAIGNIAVRDIPKTLDELKAL